MNFETQDVAVGGEYKNVLVHNGTSRDFAVIFVRATAEALPLEQFQRIYGLTAMQGEINEARLAEIKGFLSKSYQVLNQKGNEDCDDRRGNDKVDP